MRSREGQSSPKSPGVPYYLLRPEERLDGVLSSRSDGGAGPSSSVTQQGTRRSAAEEASSGTIMHKVTKMDTLAGIAIKYNVTVADIKRANGLLSDNALYARDVLQIPVGGVPLGEELQVMFMRTYLGLGRDPVLNAEANVHPASSAAARAAKTLKLVDSKSFGGGAGGGVPWWCSCGDCNEDLGRVACRERRPRLGDGSDSDEEPGEYELQERGNSDAAQPRPNHSVLLPPDVAGGPTRMHANVHRRRAARTECDSLQAADSSFSYQDDALVQLHQLQAPRPGPSSYYTTSQQQHSHSQHRSRHWPPPGPPPPPWGSVGQISQSSLGNQGGGLGTVLQGETLASMMKQVSSLGQAFGDLSIVQRLKAAASQPALAGPQLRHASLSGVAEGVLGSFKGLVGGTQRAAGGSTGGGPDMPLVPRSQYVSGDGSSRGAPVAAAAARRKAGDKAD